VATRRNDYNDVSMPFLDHLEELRRRLFYCAVAVLVGGIITYGLFNIPGFDILEFLARPARMHLGGQKMVTHGSADIFQMLLNAGFVVAMIIASPVIAYQLWGFVAPAMYAKEKRIVIPIILGSVTLFVLGVALAFFFVMPATMEFFLGFQTEAAVPMLTLKEFITLEIYMCVGFGIAFQLPIVILGLTAVGIVTPTFLAKGRRFAIVGVLIISAAITPDPTTMFLMAVPLYALYELSIWGSKFIYRWRQRREAAQDEDDESERPPTRGEPLRLGAPS
jgi:sec-independent protein translocase protein TatC